MADPKDDIFKDFALPQEWAGTDEEDQPDEKPDPVKALEEQLAELQRKVGEEDLRRTAPAQQQQAPQRPPMFPDLSNLPDPMEDAEGYAREVAARTVIHQEQKKRYEDYQRSVKDETDRRTEALWTDFATQFPEYAQRPEDRDLVEFTARKLAQEAAARGIDVERYAFVHSDRFVADVGARMKKMFPKGEQTREKPEAADRTTGIFGGMESGGTPAGARGGDKAPDMIDELQAIQQRTGFF